MKDDILTLDQFLDVTEKRDKNILDALSRLEQQIIEARKEISTLITEHSVLESKFVTHEGRQDRDIADIKSNIQSNWTYTYSLNEKLNQLNSSIELIKESNKSRDNNIIEMKAEDSWLKQNIIKLLFGFAGSSGVGYAMFKEFIEK